MIYYYFPFCLVVTFNETLSSKIHNLYSDEDYCVFRTLYTVFMIIFVSRCSLLKDIGDCKKVPILWNIQNSLGCVYTGPVLRLQINTYQMPSVTLCQCLFKAGKITSEVNISKIRFCFYYI